MVVFLVRLLVGFLIRLLDRLLDLAVVLLMFAVLVLVLVADRAVIGIEMTSHDKRPQTTPQKLSAMKLGQDTK